MAAIHTGSTLAFRRCQLRDSNFFGLQLEEMILESCLAGRVDFREADLTRAVLTGTDFEGAQFGKTNLEEADLAGATRYAIDVFDNRRRLTGPCPCPFLIETCPRRRCSGTRGVTRIGLDPSREVSAPD